MKKVYIQSSVKNIPAGFWEWLAEILRNSAILGWGAEHFECYSENFTRLCIAFVQHSRSSNIHVAFETFGKRGQLGRSIAAMTTSSADLDLIS